MFDNLGLALAMALNVYASTGKGLKLKLRKFWGTNSYVCRGYRGKTSRGGLFFPHHE